jgi:AraC-like DNA-binding protein
MNQIPAPTFDFWTFLYAGFAFIGLFYSVKLIAARTKWTMDHVLGIYLLLQSVTLLEFVLYWTHLIFSAHFFADISLLFPILYGPLLLIYFERSFGNDKPIGKYVPHFIPFFILLLLKTPFYLNSSETKFFHILDIPFANFFTDYFPWLKLWHMSVYCVILFALITSHVGVGFMRPWARWVVGFFSFYVLLCFVYQGLVQFKLLTSQLDYFVSLATSATIFFIAWYGKGITKVVDGMSILDSLRGDAIQPRRTAKNEMIIESTISGFEKYRNSGLPKSLETKLAQDLEKLMYEQKLYKQNDLKLETLAEKLDTNKHFISQVINEIHKINFFEYVNLKRIEEAKQLLRSTPKSEFNIIEIAYEVGFNNKGTFNSVFKRITGLTPSEFRAQSKQLLESRSN